MHGRVNSLIEAMVEVVALDSNGEFAIIDAIVDTASNAPLTLPPDLIHELALQPVRGIKSTLADGSELESPVYLARLFIRGEAVDVDVVEVNGDPLLGMPLMEGCSLHIEVVSGGEVAIEPLV